MAEKCRSNRSHYQSIKDRSEQVFSSDNIECSQLNKRTGRQSLIFVNGFYYFLIKHIKEALGAVQEITGKGGGWACQS